MPFTKIGPNKYTSPAGNTFDRKQIQMYYANGGRFPGQKGMAEMFPRQSPATPLPQIPQPMKMKWGR